MSQSRDQLVASTFYRHREAIEDALHAAGYIGAYEEIVDLPLDRSPEVEWHQIRGDVPDDLILRQIAGDR